jgi:Family of unknown function (DUF5522)
MNDEHPELTVGEDYYLENGKWVFTAKYLLRRGYCCRSGCRHCPYGYVRDNELSEGDSGGAISK